MTMPVPVAPMIVPSEDAAEKTTEDLADESEDAAENSTDETKQSSDQSKDKSEESTG